MPVKKKRTVGAVINVGGKSLRFVKAKNCLSQ